MAYDLKHTGEAVDAAVSAVENGSVVTDNTVSSIAPNEAKPASAGAIAKELQKKVDKVEGKGLSTNDYTNEEKEQLANNTKDIATNTEKIAEQGAMLSKHGEDIAKNAEDIAKKANMTEYYPAMAVGVADNLRGRGEATEEYFTYRPSAGASNSISEEGVATMKRIKGNSVVWNQYATFKDSWTENGLTCVKEGNTIHIYGTVTEAFPGDVCRLTNYLSQGLKRDGRKYLISMNAPDGVAYGINGYAISKTKPHFWSDEADSVWYGYISIKIPVGTTVDYVLSDPQIIDLTQMFGAGNEPSTIEEFYARIPEGVDINAYNKGELISLTAESIKTTGLNQWDEQWVNGYINVNNGNLAAHDVRIASANFCSCLPNTEYYFKSQGRINVLFYDDFRNYIGYLHFSNNGKRTTPKNARFFKINTYEEYGPTYNNDICINLSHSGVRDGQYEPYEEHTIDLPEIARYFSDGMKSVGGVFDEINEHEAVQRVGQRAYAEGDKDNPAVMTDGVNTIYLLDTPIVTPMPARAINLNYPVWDWGTERAVSDVPSAPFRADIIYGFNAVDTIRTNKLNIEDILRRLAELEAKAVTEQNVEE